MVVNKNFVYKRKQSKKHSNKKDKHKKDEKEEDDDLMLPKPEKGVFILEPNEEETTRDKSFVITNVPYNTKLIIRSKIF